MNTNTAATTVQSTVVAITTVEVVSYGPLLAKEDISFTSNDFVLIVGQDPAVPKWQIHLSIVMPQIEEVLNKVLPILKQHGVTFCLVKDATIAEKTLLGEYGIKQFAKILSAFPESDAQAVSLSQQLSAITQGYNAPEIATAVALGGLVYAEYIGKEHFKPGMWPFAVPLPATIKKTDQILNKRYRIIKTLRENVKGDVYKAIYLKRWFLLGTCVIKEGRKHLWVDEANRNMHDRIKWQYQLQKDLQTLVNVPKVIDLFYAHGNAYFAMEYIKGVNLMQTVEDIYGKQTWLQLPLLKKERLINYIVRVIDIVSILHQHGYVHRDLSPFNFIVGPKDRIVPIDLELAYYIHQSGVPPLPFGNGTKGFCSPQQKERKGIPTIHEDIYGLGGFMLMIFAKEIPEKFDFLHPDHLAEELQPIIQDDAIIQLIAACYAPDIIDRPTLAEIKTEMRKFQQRLNSL